jgi:hypothetical protein
LRSIRAHEGSDCSHLQPWRGEYVLKAADTYRSAIDTTQVRIIEQRCNRTWIDVTVTMKVREKASLVLCACEIDCEHAAISFEDTAHFTRALLTCLPWQVMEHQRAEHQIELRVGKGKYFGGCVLELDGNLSFGLF